MDRDILIPHGFISKAQQNNTVHTASPLRFEPPFSYSACVLLCGRLAEGYTKEELAGVCICLCVKQCAITNRCTLANCLCFKDKTHSRLTNRRHCWSRLSLSSTRCNLDVMRGKRKKWAVRMPQDEVCPLWSCCLKAHFDTPDCSLIQLF